MSCADIKLLYQSYSSQSSCCSQKNKSLNTDQLMKLQSMSFDVPFEAFSVYGAIGGFIQAYKMNDTAQTQSHFENKYTLRVMNSTQRFLFQDVPGFRTLPITEENLETSYPTAGVISYMENSMPRMIPMVALQISDYENFTIIANTTTSRISTNAKILLSAMQMGKYHSSLSLAATFRKCSFRTKQYGRFDAFLDNQVEYLTYSNKEHHGFEFMNGSSAQKMWKSWSTRNAAIIPFTSLDSSSIIRLDNIQETTRGISVQGTFLDSKLYNQAEGPCILHVDALSSTKIYNFVSRLICLLLEESVEVGAMIATCFGESAVGLAEVCVITNRFIVETAIKTSLQVVNTIEDVLPGSTDLTRSEFITDVVSVILDALGLFISGLECIDGDLFACLGGIATAVSLGVDINNLDTLSKRIGAQIPATRYSNYNADWSTEWNGDENGVICCNTQGKPGNEQYDEQCFAAECISKIQKQRTSWKYSISTWHYRDVCSAAQCLRLQPMDTEAWKNNREIRYNGLARSGDDQCRYSITNSQNQRGLWDVDFSNWKDGGDFAYQMACKPWIQVTQS